MSGHNYWERLSKFKLNSNERRMERYAIFYVWKSMNGIVPSLGLEWNNHKSRNGSTLKLPSMKGDAGAPKTILRNSIKYDGVRIFNTMPEHLKIWKGSKENFKKMLDEFLSVIPDQPEVEGLYPEAKTIDRIPSNSVVV